MAQKITIHKGDDKSFNALWWTPLFDWQRQMSDALHSNAATFVPPPLQNLEKNILNGWQQNVNRLFSELFNNRQMYMPWWLGAQTEPYVDILENEKSFFVKAILSGIDKEDLNVSVSDKALVIRGGNGKENGKENGLEGAHYIRHECGNGVFCRTIALPGEADLDKAEANFDRNVLIVEIPKKPGGQGKASRPSAMPKEQKSA